MAVRHLSRAMKISLILMAATVLSGCGNTSMTYSGSTEIPAEHQDILTIDGSHTNKLENDTFAKAILSEADYKVYEQAMAEARERRAYQSVEVQYQQAKLAWYADYLTAYSMGIIDATGIPTGKVEDVRFTLDIMTVEEALQQLQSATKDEFITKLSAMYFCTEGPSETYGYPDVLFYQFYEPGGAEYGYLTREAIEAATLEDLQNWFIHFAEVEKENLAKKETKVAVSLEELNSVANQLLQRDYVNIYTDSRIVELSTGEHAILKSDLEQGSYEYMGRPVNNLTMFGSDTIVQLTDEAFVNWTDINVEFGTIEGASTGTPSYGYSISMKVNGAPVELVAIPMVDGTGYDIDDNALRSLFAVQSISVPDYTEHSSNLDALNGMMNNSKPLEVVTESEAAVVSITIKGEQNGEQSTGNSHSADMHYGESDGVSTQ